MFKIYCKECGNEIGTTSKEELVQVTADSILCTDCTEEEEAIEDEEEEEEAEQEES